MQLAACGSALASSQRNDPRNTSLVHPQILFSVTSAPFHAIQLGQSTKSWPRYMARHPFGVLHRTKYSPRLIGSIIYLAVGAKPIIILNNADDAHNILEKRGSNYSDRTRAILQGEM